MKCPKCGTKMKAAINADLYVCVSCSMAFSGITVRAKTRTGQTWTQFLNEAKEEYKKVGEKVKRGEML